MATTQVAVRLPDELLRSLDELVAQGAYPSRAAAVREALEEAMATRQRRAVDRAVVDGYRRAPSTTAETDAAVASLRDAITEEPW